MHRILALSCSIFFACDDAARPAGDAPSPSHAPELRPLITPEEAQALLAKWQGAWVMPFRTVSSMDAPPSPIGSHEVWAIEGDRLTRWDGTVAESFTIEVLAPCLLMRRKGDTSSAHEFAFVEAGLFVGALALGVHAADRSIMCADRTAYTLDEGLCRMWERPLVARGDALRPEGAECSIAVGPDGKKSFEVAATADFSAKSSGIEKDLIRPDLAPPKPAQRFATMAEAQASLR